MLWTLWLSKCIFKETSFYLLIRSVGLVGALKQKHIKGVFFYKTVILKISKQTFVCKQFLMIKVFYFSKLVFL